MSTGLEFSTFLTFCRPYKQRTIQLDWGEQIPWVEALKHTINGKQTQCSFKATENVCCAILTTANQCSIKERVTNFSKQPFKPTGIEFGTKKTNSWWSTTLKPQVHLTHSKHRYHNCLESQITVILHIGTLANLSDINQRERWKVEIRERSVV